MKPSLESSGPLSLVEGKSPKITVGQFFKDHGEYLQLRLVGPERGFDRKILEPTINRPGLALSGFFKYFAAKRIQVVGSAEMSYLKSLPAGRRRQTVPRAVHPADSVRGVLARRGHPARAVRRGRAGGDRRFPHSAGDDEFRQRGDHRLEFDFSPSRTEHGSMVDVLGVGTLIRGASGIGKSECVLGLIERGYSLVADDVTRIRAIERRELMATAPSLTRYHMEVRGLGVINVAAIFGIGSIRTEKRLDLVVTLKDWQDMEEVDRVGLEQEVYRILNISVPHITIPVRPGRDMARLVEVAASGPEAQEPRPARLAGI